MRAATAHNELLEVLRSAKEFLALPTNDFSWSSWQDADAAIREIDELIGIVEKGKLPRREKISILFAPTGPIQEVSLNGGWADKFLTLADKADDALERVYARRWFDWLIRIFCADREK